MYRLEMRSLGERMNEVNLIAIQETGNPVIFQHHKVDNTSPGRAERHHLIKLTEKQRIKR